MKRFVTTFCVFVFGLVVLASGFNAALDHAGSSSLTSVTVCDDHGAAMFTYNGSFENCRANLKPNVAPDYRFPHRT